MTKELIVYVNADGTPTGETAPKLDAHNADTKLHLAFSCYVFDDKGHVLVTERASTKKVWSGVWSGSVCGHPGPGEEVTDAIARRLDQELGMTVTDLTVVLPKYTYKTPPFNGVIEHEFCPVYVARASSVAIPNPEEVDDYSWMPWHAFVEIALADKADVWSWWTKDQLKQLQDLPIIAEYTNPKSAPDEQTT